ncbi:hypothetical protein KJ652_05080 [Patescibacteria group bacterium]|nr:hypothetical protein [Patescibacteria group bacterium]
MSETNYSRQLEELVMRAAKRGADRQSIAAVIEELQGKIQSNPEIALSEQTKDSPAVGEAVEEAKKKLRALCGDFN